MKRLSRTIYIPFLILIGLTVLFTIDKANAQTKNLEIFVANSSSGCTGRSQCFFNDAPDTLEATGLYKAISFAKQNDLAGADIHILAPYEIKTQQVNVDFPVNLIGESGGWISTSSSNCSQAMLLISAKVTLRNIYLTDGNCTSPSRDLIHVGSPEEVIIEHSTFDGGANAIVHLNSLGNLTIRTSELINNTESALTSQNTEVTSRLVMLANNIIGNGFGVQVDCANNSFVDHNYWGDGVLPSTSAPNCTSDNNKILGAKILSEQVGVAARLVSLGTSYPANDFYGLWAKGDPGRSLYLVNHANNRPFPSSFTSQITVCSNFFDVFLAENSNPGSVTLSFRYDLNQNCQVAVQSMSLCGSGDPKKFPLMWHDPKTSVTDGWDNVGDSPQTEAGNIFSGQEVSCDVQNKRIEVALDNDGRPDLLNDLHFTPFVVGFESTPVSQFTAREDRAGTVTLQWATTSEANTTGFRIVRSTLEAGPYTTIGQIVPAKGSSSTGGSYLLDDSSVSAGTLYYYKLEVIDNRGNVQNSLGPVRIQTQAAGSTSTATATVTSVGARPTSTKIPTRTSTPFLTATNSFRTPRPTNFIPTYTSSPIVTPTSTPTDVEFIKPTFAQSTRTLRPTYDAGQLLDKKDQDGRSNNLLWLPIVLFVIGGSLGVYFYLTRKKS